MNNSVGAAGRQNRLKMKKLILIIIVIAVPFAGFARNDGNSVPADRLMSLISSYRGERGFEVVKIGSFGTSLLKSAMKLSMSMENDEDIRKAMDIMKGVRKMAVVEYDGCDPETRRTFNSKLEKLLGNANILLEAKDGDETVRIYGMMDPDGNEIRDFIMHTPEDGALICLFGSLPVDTIMEFAEENAGNAKLPEK